MTMTGAAAREYAMETGRLPDGLREVEGWLDLQDTRISDLGGLREVEDDLYLGGTPISDLGSLREVGGKLDLEGTPIKSLGSLREVGGALDLRRTPIQSLGELREVGGNLYLWNTRIKSLGGLASVGGDLKLPEGYIDGGALPPDVPVIPDIHRAVYAAAGAPGALDMTDWHTCDTTHCRAGWVVTLAGEAGAELERRWGTPAAAAFIYGASDPSMDRIPDWTADEGEALADMARMAEEKI